jgi:hypothetical protein
VDHPAPQQRRGFRRLRAASRLIVAGGLLAAAAWGVLAIWICLPVRPALASVAAGAAAVLVIAAPLALPRRRFPVVMIVWPSVAVAGLGVFFSRQASNDRDWQPDVSLLPWAQIQGNRFRLHNIRDFRYRSESDFQQSYHDADYDLSRLQSVDLFLSYWGPEAIAHTILSFGFDDGRYLCVSIETRKERGESYSALLGFFRQYELIYIAGEERDLIGVRAAHRNENVYLYRLKYDLDKARTVLLSYLHRMNDLHQQPAWYNAGTSNCTTNIRGHMLPLERHHQFSWRILLNGYIDELAYERGAVARSVPFDELRQRSLISDLATSCPEPGQFSSWIRSRLLVP